MSTPKGKFRNLTAGETGLIRMIFGDSISTSRVKIYHREWRVLLGMQKNNTVMTPNGNMYYPTGLFKEDFSTDVIHIEDLHLFIHEMVHVWQHQRGFSVIRKGMVSFDRSRYSYKLDEDKKLSNYEMEAQAELIADYFLLLKFGDLGSNHLAEQRYKYMDRNTLLPLYEAVLADFLANPHDDNNLPGRRNNRRSGRRNPQLRRENHQ